MSNVTENGNETVEETKELEWYYEPDSGSFYTVDGELIGCEFHPRERLFKDSDGNSYKFRKVNQSAQGQFWIAYEKKNKPKVPRKAYDIGDGDFSWESDPNDMAYKEELEAYNQRLAFDLSKYQVAMSLKWLMPPIDEWDDDLQFLFDYEVDESDALARFAKPFFYLSHTLPELEWTILQTLIMGQELPTVKEVNQAIERFPGNSESLAS